MKKEHKTIVVILVGFFLGMFLATQYIAKSVEYSNLLGDPLFIYQETPIYAPYKFFFWKTDFGEVLSEIFFTATFYLAGPVFIAGIIAIVIMQKEKSVDTHGSASWAEYPKDYYKAGLLKQKAKTPEGIFLGQAQDGQYLTDNENTHMLLCAPTRSGKGVSTVIPTLLTWKSSAFVNDIKGELWRETSWTRKKMGHKVIQFNPADATGVATPFNPLDEIRLRTLQEMRDVGNITEMLVDPTGEKKQRDFWDSTAKAFITAVLLHLKYTKEYVTFTDVSNFMRDASAPLEDRLLDLIDYPHDPEGNLFEEIYGIKSTTHPEVAMGFRSFIGTPDDTRGGILKSAETFLDLFVDPLIRKNTSKSGFKIRDLMYHETPVTLYLCIPPGDMDRLKPLLRLMVQQVISQLTDPDNLGERNQTGNKHSLLLLLDELPALGKMGIIQRALGYMAGYGLRGLLVAQSINQLNEIYGHDNQVVDGCHTRIFHAPNEHTTAKYISDMLGQATVQTKSISYSGLKWFAKKNTTLSYTGRSLLMPAEVMNLSQEKEIIFVARNKPILCNKITYYQDYNFTSREGTKEQKLAMQSDKILSLGEL